MWGIHRGPVNSPHKWPVMRKRFPFDDVIKIMYFHMCFFYVISSKFIACNLDVQCVCTKAIKISYFALCFWCLLDKQRGLITVYDGRDLDQDTFRYWLVAYSVAIHYPNFCCLIVNSTLLAKFESKTIIHMNENAFQNAVYKISAILLKPHYVKISIRKTYHCLNAIRR